MTALFDARSFALFDGLRRRHFPPEINRVPAHATLFHHLAGEDLREISLAVAAACGRTAPFPFAIERTRFLGRGVAFALLSEELESFRAGLADLWRSRLTPQDRQAYKPHVTILNKVAPDAARAAEASLQGVLPLSGTIAGIALWHYRGGPWDEAGRFFFRS